jgi:hypothetical protein
VYSTLYAIRESPVKKGVIWAGSNDGLISVTRDDGKTWKVVTPAGLEAGGRVQNIEPSPHHAGTAYAAIYRYLLGDFQPYIYRTDDYGTNWTRLTDGTNGIAKNEPTRVVREDPDVAGLLYAGTEFGIYISFDNGAHWQDFKTNLPVTPVTDIRIKHEDLILSTQGRSFWIMDDITPLHQLADAAKAKEFLFKPREAVRTVRHSAGEGGGSGGGSGAPQYPEAGAEINYYLADGGCEEHAQDGRGVTLAAQRPGEVLSDSAASSRALCAPRDLRLEILDSKGTVVRKFTPDVPKETSAEEDEEGPSRSKAVLSNAKGMHRFIWDLRYAGPWISAARPEGPGGPTAVPGRYQVRLTDGEWSSTQPLTLIEDPRTTRAGVTTAELQEQFEHNVRVSQLVSEVNHAVAKLKEAQAEARAKAMTDQGQKEKLSELDDLAGDLITPLIRYSKPELQTHIRYLYSLTNETDQKIGKDAGERYRVLRNELDRLVKELNRLVGK